MVNVYHRFFKFPELTFHPDWPMFGVALAGQRGGGVPRRDRRGAAGREAAARGGDAPGAARGIHSPSLVERLGLAQLVEPGFPHGAAQSRAQAVAGLFTAFGLALATGIPIVPGAMRDGINYLLDFQWDVAQRQRRDRQAHRARLRGGTRGHAASARRDDSPSRFAACRARLRFGHHSRRLGVTRAAPRRLLNRLLDADAQPIALPPGWPARLRKARGNPRREAWRPVMLEVQEGRRPTREAAIQGLITDYAGIAAYMEIGALRRLMREGGTVSGAHLVGRCRAVAGRSSRR